MTLRSRERVLQALCVVVLLAAVLPNVALAGHVASRSLPAEAAEASVPDHDHTGHNHSLTGVASGIWWLSDGASLSFAHGQERPQFSSQDSLAADPFVDPVSPPPRYL